MGIEATDLGGRVGGFRGILPERGFLAAPDATSRRSPGYPRPPMADDDFTGDAPHADPAQFDRVIESVAPDEVLVVIARSMGATLRGRYEPEDVWQETLASAWRDRTTHRWEGLHSYRTWLISIARNRIRDFARADGAAKRGGTGGTGLFSERNPSDSVSLADVLPAGSVTPSRVASHRERSRILTEALEKLPPDVEPYVRMHLFEDKPMETIAAELNAHVSAAWRRFRRGSQLFRDLVKSLESRSMPPGGPGS